MAEGRSRQRWAHTSALLAMLANVHRDPAKPRAKPSDFNPHAAEDRRRQPSIAKVGINVLKQVFIDRDRASRDRASEIRQAGTTEHQQTEQ